MNVRVMKQSAGKSKKVDKAFKKLESDSRWTMSAHDDLGRYVEMVFEAPSTITNRYAAEDAARASFEALTGVSSWLHNSADEEVLSFNGLVPNYRVRFHENNSGGLYRLDATDWENLRRNSWDVDRSGHNAYRDVIADDEEAAISQAIDEWERITHCYAHSVGCDCCGRPFYFSAAEKDEEEEED